MNGNQENLLATIRVDSRLTAGKEEPRMNANKRELVEFISGYSRVLAVNRKRSC